MYLVSHQPVRLPSEAEIDAGVRAEWCENRGHGWPETGYDDPQVGAVLRGMRAGVERILRAGGSGVAARIDALTDDDCMGILFETQGVGFMQDDPVNKLRAALRARLLREGSK